jgi:hypothetical protein
LAVPLPSLEVQNRIVDIQRVSLREQSLLDEIQLRRRNLVEGQLMEAAWRFASDGQTANGQ